MSQLFKWCILLNLYKLLIHIIQKFYLQNKLQLGQKNTLSQNFCQPLYLYTAWSQHCCRKKQKTEGIYATVLNVYARVYGIALFE